MFSGRKRELQLLEYRYYSQKSELIVIYGRRRIGKTTLVKRFIENKPYVFTSEGIEGEGSRYQICHFSEKAIEYSSDSFVNAASFTDWKKSFSFLTKKIIANKRRKKKFILFFDEIQWMAAGQGRLISIIKYYWDNYWKGQNVMLLLCGSIASFMVTKVISSKALYGRITAEVLLKGLKPDEAAQLFKGKRSKEEILKYLLVFGGVPKYLEEINLKRSFNQNINSLCFSANSPMIKEIGKTFYNQFRYTETYVRIVKLLRNSMCSLDEVAKRLGKKSGGSLKDALAHLEKAEIIKSYFSFDKRWKKRYSKYRIFDEYITFYFKFMEPHLNIISENERKNLFESIAQNNFSTWLGFAFERFCLKHALYLAKKLDIEDKITSFAPCFSKDDSAFQIDLVYQRTDKVITVCEVKFQTKKTSTSIIPEMRKKLSSLSMPRGHTIHKVLICLYGPDEYLKESGFFDQYICLEDIIS